MTLDSGFAWWSAIIIVLAGAVIAGGAYPRQVRALAGKRWMLPVLLRGLGTALLLLLLLRPEITFETNREDPRTALILLDRSGSLSLRDTQETRLRTAALAARDCELNLLEGSGLVLRIVPFAETVQHSLSGEDLLRLEAQGEETDFHEAFRHAREISPPVARVILISDGNDTTGIDAVAAAVSLRVPVDTVTIGQEIQKKDTWRDVVLEGLDHQSSIPVGSVTPVVARIEATGFAGLTALVELRHKKSVLAHGEVVLDNSRGPQTITLNFHPETVGLIDLTVTVGALAGEMVLENNHLSFPLSVHEKLPRVLYIEGAMRPDYKFLRRALASDPGLEFMSLVMIREGDFLRQGSIGGIRLTGLPQSAAELNTFDVLILGNLSAQAVGEGVMQCIRQGVRDGLGFLILPADNTTGVSCAYAGTPLAPIFPAVPAGKTIQSASALSLSPEGLSHGLGKGLEQLLKGREVRISGLDEITSVRPGATTVINGSTKPLLVCGRYGKGRTAVFLGHDSWRWSLMTGRPLHAAFWGQLVRWLASENNINEGQSFTVSADRLVVRAGDEITFSASLSGTSGTPAVNAQILRGKEQVDTIGFSTVPPFAGVFEGRFSTTRPGRYTVLVKAFDNTTEVATRDISIRVRGGQSEFERLSPDRKLLARIAAETGGRELSRQELPEHIHRLAEERHALREPVRIRLWHGLGLFVAISLLFSLEWALRKRIGLS